MSVSVRCNVSIPNKKLADIKQKNLYFRVGFNLQYIVLGYLNTLFYRQCVSNGYTAPTAHEPVSQYNQSQLAYRLPVTETKVANCFTCTLSPSLYTV